MGSSSGSSLSQSVLTMFDASVKVTVSSTQIWETSWPFLIISKSASGTASIFIVSSCKSSIWQKSGFTADNLIVQQPGIVISSAGIIKSFPTSQGELLNTGIKSEAVGVL